jgi:hypothetical protein
MGPAAARYAMKGHAGNLGSSAVWGPGPTAMLSNVVPLRSPTWAWHSGKATRLRAARIHGAGTADAPRSHEGCVDHLRPHVGVSVSLVLRRHQPTPHAAGCSRLHLVFNTTNRQLQCSTYRTYLTMLSSTVCKDSGARFCFAQSAQVRGQHIRLTTFITASPQSRAGSWPRNWNGRH